MEEQPRSRALSPGYRYWILPLIGLCTLCGFARTPAAASTGFIRAHETHLLDVEDNAFVRFRGIGLGGDSNYALDSDAADVRHCAEMGASVVRVVSPARAFETDTSYGFVRFDTLARAANREGVRIIVSMDCADAESEAAACWGSSDEQDRMARGWIRIAKHLRGRPEVAAYELMAHPVFPDVRDYKLFAQYLIDSIREIDTRHLIIATEPAGGAGFASVRHPESFLNDDNLAYGFAEYEPDAFTMQSIGRRPAGVVWPGEFVTEVKEVGEWPRRAMGGSGESKRLKLETIAPDGAEFLAPRVYVKGSGRATFSAVTVEEVNVFDRRGGDILVFADTFDRLENIWWPEPAGAHLLWERVENPGEGRIVVEGMRGTATAQPYTRYDTHLLAHAESGRRYRMTATVEAGESTEAGLGLVFLTVTAGRDDGSSLNTRMQSRADWARKAGAPMMLMEFGAVRQAPETTAIDWDSAVIQSCERNSLSWSYRTFREFGDPEHGSDRHLFGVYRATPNVPTGSAAVWPGMFDLLWNTYKRKAPVTRVVMPHEPLIHHRNPVPPPAGCWFGAAAPQSPAVPGSPTTFASIMAFARKAGKSPAWVLIHSPWKTEQGQWTKFPEDGIREISAAGSTAVIAWDLTYAPAFVLAGMADTYIRRWADESRRYQDTLVIRLPRGIDVGAYLHIFGIFEDRGAANVSWMWLPDDSDTRSVSERPWPGARAVDWIGFDVHGRPELDDTGIALKLFPADRVAERIA